MGRHPFSPTAEQRQIVRAMAGYGIPHDDIALVVKCSPPTLRRRFRENLDVATVEANARVAQCLYKQATTPGNIAATIFWLKARAGWREKQVIEVAGKDGAAVQVVIRRFSDELIAGANAATPPAWPKLPSYKQASAEEI